jgi:hypothetical protein
MLSRLVDEDGQQVENVGQFGQDLHVPRLVLPLPRPRLILLTRILPGTCALGNASPQSCKPSRLLSSSTTIHCTRPTIQWLEKVSIAINEDTH